LYVAMEGRKVWFTAHVALQQMQRLCTFASTSVCHSAAGTNIEEVGGREKVRVAAGRSRLLPHAYGAWVGGMGRG